MLSNFQRKLILTASLFFLIIAAAEGSTLAGFIQKESPSISRETARRVAQALEQNSKKYNIPLEIVVAIARLESGFNPKAKGKGGAYGLMQVIWRIHSKFLRANGIPNERVLFEPNAGAKAGCLILSGYIKQTDSLEAALGRYYGKSGTAYLARLKKIMESYRRYMK